MFDSNDGDRFAASVPRFTGGRAAWIDAYVTSASRLNPQADAAALAAAAQAAHHTQGWVHPVVIAFLDRELGPMAPA